MNLKIEKLPDYLKKYVDAFFKNGATDINVVRSNSSLSTYFKVEYHKGPDFFAIIEIRISDHKRNRNIFGIDSFEIGTDDPIIIAQLAYEFAKKNNLLNL